jgi:septum formation protein
LQDGFSFEDLVILLAELKAEAVSQRHIGYVLGCDQILICANQLFSKPKNLTEARSHLLALQGRKHVLITACVLFHDQKRIWHHLSTSNLMMRALSEVEIDNYIAGFPEACMSTPGAYQFEAGGAHLFTDIAGSNYDILGLPMLPLLAFLREHGLTVRKTG